MLSAVLFGIAAAVVALLPVVAVAVVERVERGRCVTFVYHPDLRIWIPSRQYRLECARLVRKGCGGAGL